MCGSGILRADHFAQTAAGSRQILLQLGDPVLERLKLGDLLFKSPVGIGEFGDARGHLLVADLVELPTVPVPPVPGWTGCDTVNAIRPQPGTAPLDVTTMRATSHRLLSPDAEPPSPAELDTLTLQLRGHIMVTIPDVETAAAQLPEDDTTLCPIRASPVRSLREPRWRTHMTATPHVCHSCEWPITEPDDETGQDVRELPSATTR